MLANSEGLSPELIVQLCLSLPFTAFVCLARVVSSAKLWGPSCSRHRHWVQIALEDYGET
jgi:hypothetical protein